MLHPVEQAVLRQSRALFHPGDRVVVGLSAGPDSTALLAALRTVCPLHLVAAHLDHQLREGSARDVEAARSIAERLDVPFVAGQANTRAEAAERGTGSLEAAARAVRYRFLGRVAEAEDSRRVALAHTACDQAETVLMRVLRGTSIRGLAGIPRRRKLSRSLPHVQVVRPLLETTREQVLDYLDGQDLPWVHDPSNDDTTFLRNRLRSEVLPLLREEVNPQVDDALLRLASQAKRVDHHLRHLASQMLAEACQGEPPSSWKVGALSTADPAVRAQALSLLLDELAPGRVEAHHVHAMERLLLGSTPAVSLPGGSLARTEGDRLVIRGADEPPPPPSALEIELSIPGEALDDAAGLRFSARVVEPSQANLSADPASEAFLDADRIQGTLTIRRRRPGDRFWPLGAPGHRSLKRFFIDQKVPRRQRDVIPLVTLEDQPVWVVGHRIDEQFKVTPATTRVLELSASSAAGDRKESVS